MLPDMSQKERDGKFLKSTSMIIEYFECRTDLKVNG